MRTVLERTPQCIYKYEVHRKTYSLQFFPYTTNDEALNFAIEFYHHRGKFLSVGVRTNTGKSFQIC